MAFTNQIKLILFSQHGMIDNNERMGSLAHRIAPPQSSVIAPNLGFIETLFEIEPLIGKVEQIAEQKFIQYPNTPARIIASSLGGVIWVEVLSKHPEWWKRFESIVLLGSPIGGADLARIVDPFGWGMYFRTVPGITDASERDFPSAKTIFSFADGTSIKAWKNIVGVNHIFIANKHGKCEYAAFVGWIHSVGLQEAINIAIKSF